MRRYLLLIPLTALALAAVTYFWVLSFHTVALPFTVTVTDANTGVITPMRGAALPDGIEVGDEMDLSALGPDARSAVATVTFLSIGHHLPLGAGYDFVLRHDGESRHVAVKTVELAPILSVRWFGWLTSLATTLFSITGLLAMWRGRDRAAAAMAVWMFTNVFALALLDFPADGLHGVLLVSFAGLLFLMSRVGFYIMLETMAGSALTSRARTFFRAALALLLLVGLSTLPSAALIYYLTGWAGLLKPIYSLVVTLSYLPPLVLLAFVYHKSESSRRLRLRWTLWGSAFLVFGIAVDDTVIFGFPASYIVGFVAALVGNVCFLYAVLRHRVVTLSVAVNRTLVYGSVTALVVGVIAAVNNLALKFALPAGAGLALQVIVPLALGIVLSKLRTLMDKLVEQVFFRGRYLTEQSLRGFARRAGHIDGAQDLIAATVREVTRHLGVSAAAIYSAETQGFRCMQQAGDGAYPASLGNNDDAVVAIRAEGTVTDLDRLSSALGTDSCVLPMLVLGNLRGLLVVRNRPGEHFGADEKTLLAEVAQEVGAAWRILRARENEALVLSLADGQLKTLKAARDRARALTLAW